MRAVFVRGGTSKALVFHAEDLPADPAERDELVLGMMGSPDPYGRQLDGMGGGVSSLSKVAIVARSAREDADVDYTFGQVAIDRAVVDWSGNCGNISSAIGPFAVDEGLCPRADGAAVVRIFNTNTGKIIHSRFAVRDGRAVVGGDLEIPGVPGTGAPIELSFVDPAGAGTGVLLPTGSVRDTVDLDSGRTVEVSLVDAITPTVFVAASAVGLSGSEHPSTIDAQEELLTLLDEIRRRGAVAMGLAPEPAKVADAVPMIALVAPPQEFADLSGRIVRAEEHDVCLRMLAMGKAHRATAVTTALCTAVASFVDGTLVDQARRAGAPQEPGPDSDGGRQLRIGTPSGVVQVGARVGRDADGWVVDEASVYRTARPLMRGVVIARE